MVSQSSLLNAKCEGLTCERDSLGRREDRVCLFLLWASRSTNMTDQEQPCRAETVKKEALLTLLIKQLSCIYQRKETLDSQTAALQGPHV